MSEQQADNDTDNTQPTPGPWEIDRSPAWEDQITSGDYTVATVHYGMAGKARANARLIAAAGTAASELPEEYDPVAAVEALPELLEAAEEALQEMRWIVDGETSSRVPTEDEAAVRNMLAEVLYVARKDTTQNNE
jgi:anti-sigma factor ChrR (cupin superfamily)